MPEVKSSLFDDHISSAFLFMSGAGRKVDEKLGLSENYHHKTLKQKLFLLKATVSHWFLHPVVFQNIFLNISLVYGIYFSIS